MYIMQDMYVGTHAHVVTQNAKHAHSHTCI